MGSDEAMHRQVIVHVIAGLILAAILAGVGWAAGLLPAVWEWVVGVGKAAWAVLLFRIPVPVWLLLLFVVTGFLVAFRVARRPAELQSAGAGSVTTHLAPLAVSATGSHTSSPQLSDLETQIVRALVVADGEWVRLDELVGRLGVPRLLVEQGLDNLHARDLIDDRLNVFEGTSFRLSPRGRHFAIQEGFVSHGGKA